jgi:hypothetical protein
MHPRHRVMSEIRLRRCRLHLGPHWLQLLQEVEECFCCGGYCWGPLNSVSWYRICVPFFSEDLEAGTRDSAGGMQLFLGCVAH